MFVKVQLLLPGLCWRIEPNWKKNTCHI